MRDFKLFNEVRLGDVFQQRDGCYRAIVTYKDEYSICVVFMDGFVRKFNATEWQIGEHQWRFKTTNHKVTLEAM